MMWGYYNAYNPWVMVLGMLAQTLVWLIVAGALLWLALRLVHGRPPGDWHVFGGPPATEILRQRYARGEIDAATYEEMMRRLAQSAADAPQRRPTTL